MDAVTFNVDQKLKDTCFFIHLDCGKITFKSDDFTYQLTVTHTNLYIQEQNGYIDNHYEHLLS